jgi:chorismate mutase
MKPDEIHKKISKIDRELLVLLQERMGLALRSKKFKETRGDPEHENELLARVERLNLDLIESSFTRQLLKTIVEESRRIQDEDRSLAAFQGEHGAYGEVAARKLVPQAPAFRVWSLSMCSGESKMAASISAWCRSRTH